MHSTNQFVDNQFVNVRHDGGVLSVLEGTYSTEDDLDTQLTAFNASYYTPELLASLSMNDKIFATRFAEELEGSSGMSVLPLARFSFAPTLLVVQFTDESTIPNGIPITDWAWDFGDVGSSTQRDPRHTYGAAGDYTV